MGLGLGECEISRRHDLYYAPALRKRAGPDSDWERRGSLI